MSVCPYCANDVRPGAWPWEHQRHDVNGKADGAGAASVCVGSRNVYTLALLGLRALEPELVPRQQGAA